MDRRFSRLVTIAAAAAVLCALAPVSNAGAARPGSPCGALQGAAFGICNAFCGQDCPTHPSETSCQQLRKNFAKHAGTSTFPCEGASAPTQTPLVPTPTVTATPHSGGASIRFNMTVNATYPRGPDFSLPLGTINHSDPATVLVMPFDVTENRTSLQIVSRTISSELDPVGSGLVATHWSYWSESCDHLADVFICLAQNDTVAVDPTALQGETQSGGINVKTGPVIDLSGTRGVVIVSTFEADPGSLSCNVIDPADPLSDPTIVGSWTIGSTVDASVAGGTAVGFTELPDPFVLNGDFGFDAGIAIQTMNPELLTHSRIFLMGVQAGNGNGAFFDSDPGPITRPLPGGREANVCCAASFTDDLGTVTALPDVCFKCAGFASIVGSAADPGDPPIIPGSIAANTPGTLRLTHCITANEDGFIVPIGDEAPQFIVGFHAQTIQ